MINGLDVIRLYDLDYYLSCLIKYNQGNKNPYHNLYHTLTVVKNIYLISKNEQIEDDKIRLLIIAGIFHDFNHSGGNKKSDKYNIVDAITAYHTYTKETSDDSFFIVKLIAITEYPFLDVELDIYQKIIRDADAIQFLEDNYLQQNILGLIIELNKSCDITIDFIEKSIDFYKSLELFTNYAKNNTSHKFNKRIEELEYLIKTLKVY